MTTGRAYRQENFVSNMSGLKVGVAGFGVVGNAAESNKGIACRI
jgi:hypothetical protein